LHIFCARLGCRPCRQIPIYLNTALIGLFQFTTWQRKKQYLYSPGECGNNGLILLTTGKELCYNSQKNMESFMREEREYALQCA
ncbi:MAG: hypothetical protein ACI4P4_02605, partial [Faecousia sp.]